MVDQSRVVSLVAKWEEAREGGTPVAVEALCAEAPQLAGPVRAMIEKLHGATALADTLPGPHAPSPAPLDSSPDTVLGFELLDELGHGGMGVVYRARDQMLDREVAVKLLADRYPPGSGAAERFVEESCITGQLQHPGIPAVYQVGTTRRGRPFLAMKLIKGHTLDQLIERGAVLNVLATFEAVCQAVGYAHARRVLHRDLKPANVMVGAFGEVQVMDWGLAKLMATGPAPAPAKAKDPGVTATEIRTGRDSDTPMTQAGSVMGTPAYMSPEQANGETDLVDERSDVFGLGALFCALLTGSPPYSGPSAEAVRLSAMMWQTADAFARLDACGAEPEAIALCKRCLACAAAGRPPNGGAVADAVAGLRRASEERARAAELEQARGLVQAGERRKRRRTQRTLGLALVCAMLVGTAAAVWYAEAANARRGEAESAERRAVREKADADESRLTAQNEKAAADTARLTAQREKVEADAARLGAQNEKAAADVARGIAVREQRRAEWAAYSSQVSLSQREWELGNAPAAFQALDATKSELRGWEHSHLEGLYVRDRRWMKRHSIGGRLNDFIVDLAVSPNGDRVATGSSSGFTIWGASSGAQLLTVPARFQGLTTIVFSPDGRHLLTGDGQTARGNTLVSVEGTILSWKLEVGRVSPEVIAKLPGTIKSLRFNASGELMIVGCGDGRIYWVKYPSGEVLRSIGTRHGSTISVAVSSDGKFVASVGSFGDVELRDGASGALLRTFELSADALPSLYTRAQLAFSPDSELLASTRNGLFVWKVETGSKIWSTTDNASEVTRACWTPNGASLVTCSEDRTVSAWDARTGRRTRRYVGHLSGVYGLGVTPDAAFSGSSDGRVISWRADLPQVPLELRATQQGWLYDLVFAPGGTGVFSGEAGTATVARLWDLPSGRNTRTFAGHTGAVTALAVSGDGGLLVTGSQDTTARLWDVNTEGCQGVLRGHAGAVSGVACSPGGEWVATASLDGTTRVWNPKSGREQQILLSRAVPGNRLAVSPDGHRLAASYADGLIVVWNTAIWTEVTRLSHGDITGEGYPYLPLAFTPDGRLLISGGTNRRLIVWDLATGNPVWTKERDSLAAPVLSITVLPGGRQFVTGGGDWGQPGEVKVWNTATGDNTFSIRASSREIYGVAVSPKQGVLAACSHEGAVKVWGVSPDSDESQSAGRKADLLFQQAVAHSNQGEFSQAASAYRRAIGVDPSNAEYHHALGHLLQRQDDLSGAVAAFRAGISVAPKGVSDRFCLAQAHQQAGDLLAAAEVFGEAARLSPASARPQLLLSQVQLEAQLPERAEVAAREAVRLTPQDADAHVALGLALRGQGKLADAVEAAKAAVKLAPASLAARRLLDRTQGWAAYNSRLPALLDRSDSPKSPAEAIEVALFCQQPFCKRYDLAVALYRRAFAGDPKLVTRAAWAQNATCAAVQLAAGGDASVTLGDDEWYLLHAAAQGWLAADLSAQEALAKGAETDERPAIRARVTAWQRDPDLRAARDPAALAAMPPAERAAWQNLWAQAEKIVAAIRGAAPDPKGR